MPLHATSGARLADVPQSTAQKLGIKPESVTLVCGIPLPLASEILGPESNQFRVADVGDGPFAVVLLFADTVVDVSVNASSAMAKTSEGGRLWIAYRKGAGRATSGDGATPLHRDTLQAELAKLGLDGVTLVALDETWSAMRVKSV